MFTLRSSLHIEVMPYVIELQTNVSNLDQLTHIKHDFVEWSQGAVSS